jgi:hypothetical protein
VERIAVLLLMPVVVLIIVKLMSYDIDAIADEDNALPAHQQRTPAEHAFTLLHKKLVIALAVHPLVGIFVAALLPGGSPFSRMMLSLPPIAGITILSGAFVARRQLGLGFREFIREMIAREPVSATTITITVVFYVGICLLFGIREF